MPSSRSNTRLTRRQQQTLRFIAAFKREQSGLSPTYQEIADHLGITRANVCEHIDRLVDKGYLIKGEARKSRNLQLADDRPVNLSRVISLIRDVFSRVRRRKTQIGAEELQDVIIQELGNME
jgi:DNA-binding MarR family transcriptional regulator